jgi:hypothetical protein
LPGVVDAFEFVRAVAAELETLGRLGAPQHQYDESDDPTDDENDEKAGRPRALGHKRSFDARRWVQ